MNNIRIFVMICIDSAMFVISGGSGSNATLTDEITGNTTNHTVGLFVEPPNHQRNIRAFETVHDLKNGPLDLLHALDDLLDSCIMYYYGVAHKYVIMVIDSKCR